MKPSLGLLGELDLSRFTWKAFSYVFIFHFNKSFLKSMSETQNELCFFGISSKMLQSLSSTTLLLVFLKNQHFLPLTDGNEYAIFDT